MGRIDGRKCGDDPVDTWKVNGTYSSMGFRGRQLWTIKVTDTEFVNNVQTWTGTYTYRDRSTGPYGVTQKLDATGRVRLAVNPDNGDMFMGFHEQTREQSAKAPGGGWGTSVAPLSPPFDMTWTADAGC